MMSAYSQKQLKLYGSSMSMQKQREREREMRSSSFMHRGFDQGQNILVLMAGKARPHQSLIQKQGR